MKNTYPLTVVTDMELLKMMPFCRFSILMMSFFGICMNVSPKKMLLGLNFEWKHRRWVVMYNHPERIILSLRPQA